MNLPCKRVVPEGGPFVMGILNVTPDSFSDGGRWMDPEAAARHAFDMIDQGASMIDIGAESTRPGYEPIGFEEEWNRLKPVLDILLPSVDVPISIDTMRSETAYRCASMGAEIINDVSFLSDDDMVRVCVETGTALVISHNGNVEGNYFKNVIRKEIFLACEYAVGFGIPREKIIVDPGVGFGKTMEQNLDIAKDVSFLGKDYPVLLGISRKRFIKHYYPDEDIDGATARLSVSSGADILRVHDVGRTVSELEASQ